MHGSENIKFESSPYCHAVFFITNRNSALPRGSGSPFKFSIQSLYPFLIATCPTFLSFTTIDL